MSFFQPHQGPRLIAALRRATWRLLAPSGFVVLVAAILLHELIVPQGSARAVSGFALALYAAGALLALRFRSMRALLACGVLAIATYLVPALSGESLSALAFLLPLNIAALLLVEEFALETVAWWAGMIASQIILVAVASRGENAGLLAWINHPFWGASSSGLPQLATVAYLLISALFMVRYFLHGNTLEGGLFWCTVAGWMGFADQGSRTAFAVYMAAAALVVCASLIETSYLMAYQDELTRLPGRRAFNETISRLQAPYVIAMLDVDHFKKFNDTFGHDAGDQVLRMVGSRMAEVEGGGRAFRCGGEEFAVVFTNAAAEEAAEHMEVLRANIEASTFTVRGPDRSLRRRQERRFRHRPRRTRPVKISTRVTVSVGVADPFEGEAVQDVIRRADQALYVAKERGRNRVEMAVEGSEIVLS